MNTPGRDLLHVSLGDIIRDVALSIADAQRGLDAASTQTAEFMSGRVMLRDPETGGLIDVDGKPTKTPTVVSSEVMFGQEVNEQGVRIPRLVSMMELGFVPTFYQFVDTTIEMKLSVRLSGASVSQQRLSHRSGAIAHDGRRLVVQATTVDAGFASAYGYQAQLATTVSTKLRPDTATGGTGCAPIPAADRPAARPQHRQLRPARGARRARPGPRAGPRRRARARRSVQVLRRPTAARRLYRREDHRRAAGACACVSSVTRIARDGRRGDAT